MMATAMKTAKMNSLLLGKQQICTCITLFCTFLSCHCMISTWIFAIHVPALWSRWTKHKNVLFLFLNFDKVLCNSTPKNFANIWQIKWNWTGSMKFETVQIHFLRDIFGLSSRNSATMVTWHNDFPPLLYPPSRTSKIKWMPQASIRSFMLG